MLSSMKTSVSDWLVRNCNLSLEDAAELENRLRKRCFIESVGSLRQCAATTPDVLDCLRLSKSFELVLFDQLGAKGVKSLTDLTVSEVSVVLQNIFPDHQQYAAALFQSRISGYVLSTATTGQRVAELGIKDKEHALCLLGHLSTWKESGVPKHYLCVASHTAAKSPTTMLPRKRARDENMPPNIAENAGQSDKAHKAQSSNSGSHFAVSTHTNKLISADEKVRLDALIRLHKEVEKDKDMVNTFLHTGLLDRLLDMRKDPSKDFVYRMLSLLNLIIQRGDEATLDFLVLHKQLIEKLGPKMWSISHRVRMEIVRIVISVANTVHYPTLLQPSVMQAMVNMYFTAVNNVRGRDAEEVRHRLALVFKTLVLGTQDTHHVAVLMSCLPVLRDILATDQNGLTTLPAVCATLRHLIQLAANKASKTGKEGVSGETNNSVGVSVGAEKPPTVDVVGDIGRQVLPSLTTHLSSKKESTVITTLSVLSTYTACCRADQLAPLLSAFVALQKLLAQEDTSMEIKLAVLQFLQPLCRDSGQAVSLLIEAQLFPVLLSIALEEDVKSEFSQGAELEQDTKKTAAHAFFTAVEGADDNQLPHFLMIGVYASLLKLIARCAPREALQEVLRQALSLLRQLILRVDGIDEEENLSAEQEQAEVEAWMVVQRLALGYVLLPLSETQAGERTELKAEGRKVCRGEERKEVSEEVKQAAAALVKTARSVGILEVAK